MRPTSGLSALISLTIPLALSACSGQNKPPLDQRLQATLDDEIQKCGVRGVSAAVVYPDETVWTGTSGISHDTVAMQPDMLFAVGSTTKNFVAALALQLQEEGLLALEDPLSKWLPSYPHVDSTITIRQMLNHTSGIHMFWENQKIWDALKADRTKVWTPEEVLSYIEEPYFAPGEGFRYSNTNYLLTAMIIEKATGSTLASEFRRRFWRPLSIENAFLSIQEEYRDNLAHVYGDNFDNDGSDRDLTALPRASHESITFGSAGLFMTAKELARWSHALFEGDVLSRSSLDDMLRYTSFRPVAGMRAYGLGVQKYTRDLSCGKEAIGHAGGNIGSTTYMLHLPDYHTSVAVMINAFPNRCANAITKGLTKTLLKEAGVPCLLPHFEFFPKGLLLLLGAAYVTVFVGYQVHRRRKAALRREQGI